MQRQIFNSDHGVVGYFASRVGAILATTSLLLLSACGDAGDPVTKTSQDEPGPDGLAPVLTTVTIQPDGFVALGQSVRIDIVATEALMKPTVYIHGAEAEVTGSIREWRAVREMTDADTLGPIDFSIVFQDISGEAGQVVLATTNGSTAEYCGEDCPEEELGPLEGNWKLDFAGVGPNEGDTTWFSIEDTGPDGPRACWFDDLYQFGAGNGGSFSNVQGDETWLEASWQGVAEDSCGAPVAPHDGSSDAIFEYDEDAGTLKLTGLGAFLGLAKAVNGAELTDPAAAPESVTYDVVELIDNSLTVRVQAGAGWWEFRLTRISNLPVVGNWKLAFAGVGPSEGDTTWFSIEDTGPDGPRACWFDDVYHVGADGSFRNYQQGETWLEASWQGVAEDGCGAPVAPHDGSDAGGWSYDGAEGTVTVNGLGSFLGLAKAVNGAELTDPAAAPESITYDVVELIGDSMTIRIQAGAGWWEFRLERVAENAALNGNWKLDFAGVGPNEGDTTWFSIEDTGPDGPRACWFDDLYTFGAGGSFSNVQGDETWLEASWQGVAEDSCGAPVAPHDGSSDAIFEYDEDAGTLKLTGLGAFLGLAKAVNGAELTDPAAAPESVTYDVVELIDNSLTVRVQAGAGWWEFRLTRISNLPVVGNWKLAFAGVGPSEGDTTWFSIEDTGPDGPRACWFDDVYHVGADGSFRNYQQGETWLEASWQGVAEDGCGAPVAPHDGSDAGGWSYDGAEGTVTVNGLGSFLGLAKAVNGAELTDPAAAPESITYDVVELIDGSMTIRIQAGAGWWEFDLEKD